MRHSPLNLSVAVVCALLAACGGGDGSTGPVFADSASTAEITDFAGDMAGLAGLAVNQLNFGSGSNGFYEPPFVRRYQPEGSPRRAELPALVDAECLQVLRGYANGGEPVDADENEIPDDFYFRLECTAIDSTTDPDTARSYVQFMEGYVRQNDASLHGYSAGVTYRIRVTDNFGNVEGSYWEASEVLDIRSNAASHTYHYLDGGSEKNSGVPTAHEVGMTSTTSFTPTGTIVLGDPLPNGAITVSGRQYALNSEGRNLSFAIGTDTPLAYDAACRAGDSNPPFTAGALRGRLNDDVTQATFTATFTSCGNYTVDVDGAYDEPVVAVPGR
jgi:hypothetical protein